MKLEITQKGIFDQNGKEAEIGSTIDVKGDTVPAWLVNKCRPVGGSGKKAVTNPAQDPVTPVVEGYAVAEKSPGWLVVNKDGVAVTKAMRKDELEGFDAMSDEDKGAFAELHKG
ncbi:hypothetical protein [Hoeflea alexandrii]|uniref:Phage protein n=1 Tax=Hoeflea alexandrii TaxID=288436 RepID=A0ABT1CME1_9HYPH|nr:hypothetical protein [Hoeflea alexandrii]MCO6407354.1 hypothetical protein [Hoeflea alexandrii]MCY0154249.1 hypothetical protein [Hoeflea alexandrii]